MVPVINCILATLMGAFPDHNASGCCTSGSTDKGHEASCPYDIHYLWTMPTLRLKYPCRVRSTHRFRYSFTQWPAHQRTDRREGHHIHSCYSSFFFSHKDTCPIRSYRRAQAQWILLCFWSSRALWFPTSSVFGYNALGRSVHEGHEASCPYDTHSG